MKRLLAMLLVLAMVVSMLPATVLAEGMPEEETIQAEQAVDPVKDPEEDSVEPSEEETTAPTEETTDPTGETTAPTEEPTDPTGETAAPTEEVTDPTEETTEPTEETTESTGETAPTEEATEPTEETTEPEEEGTVSDEAALDAGENTGSCGDTLTWTYDEATRTLTVEGQGAMADYEYDYGQEKTNAPWANLKVKTLVLKEGITSVGQYAFYKMPTVTGALELPASLETIGEGAFGYTGLTSVALNEGLKTVGYLSFKDCEKLTLAGGFPDSLETIKMNAFFGCSALAGEIRFGSRLQTLENAVFAQSGITKVTLPDQLTAEGYNPKAFRECRSLTAIEVSEENKNFRSVDGVLYSYDGKTLLSGPAGKTGTLAVPEGVEVITEYAFCCGFLTAVELPKSLKTIEKYAFDSSPITEVTYAGSWENKAALQLNGNLQSARWHCSGGGTCGDVTWTYDEATKTLTFAGQGAIPGDSSDRMAPWSGIEVETLVVGEGITAIGEYAFLGGPLRRAELPASLTECEFAKVFFRCYKLTEVQLAAENQSFVTVDGVVYSRDQTTLLFCPTGRTESLSIPDGTKTIAKKAFYESEIQELFLPASVTEVGAEAFHNAYLQRVTYLGTQETKDQITVEDYNEAFEKAVWKMGDSQDIGDGLTWTYDGESQTLTLSGSGRMDDFTEAFPAPWQGKTVTKLVVEEGVTKLGSRGFAGLALESVSLPESLETIGADAFLDTPTGIRVSYAGSNEHWTYGVTMESCGLLNPKLTAAGENIAGDLTWRFDAKTGTLTFSGKGGLYFSGRTPDWRKWGLPVQRVVLPDNVTYIESGAFSGMTELRQVTLPKKLERIGGSAFEGSGLTGKLTIPSSTVEIGYWAFRGTAITSLELPAGVRLEADAFADCTQLTEITYPGSEAVLRDMLGDSVPQTVKLNCKAADGGSAGNGIYWTLDKQGTLTLSVSRETYDSGVLPDFYDYTDTPWAGRTVKKLVLDENMVGIGANAFNGCTSLTGELTLPENIIYLGENAFAGTGIKTLRINTNMPKDYILNVAQNRGFPVGYAQSAFAGSKLTDVYYSGAETNLRELLGEEHPLLAKKLHCAYPYGGWYYRYGDYAYLGWNISSKGVLSFASMDGDSIVISDFDPLEAPWSGYRITGLDLKNVREIGRYAFYGLNGLTKLTIPDTVETIKKYAFYGCTGLTGTLVIPEGVQTIEQRAFGNLPRITALKLPASLGYMGTNVFENCTGLKTVTFAGSMAELVYMDWNWHLWTLGAAITCQDSSTGTFDDGAAWSLDGKGTLTISGAGVLVLTDGDRDMLNRLGIRKVVIKPGITQIGESSFRDMDITEVSLPEGLTKLRGAAFAGCQKLTKITLPASLQELEDRSLDNAYLKTVTVAKGSKFLTVKGGVLYSKDMTKLLLVPAGVKKMTVPDSVTTVAEGALANGSLATLVLGAGINRDSVEGLRGIAGLVSGNNVTSLTVSKKNPSLKAVDNVLFEDTELLLYPPMRAGTEYRVPEGTQWISPFAFAADYPYLTRVVLPDSVRYVNGWAVSSAQLELVFLGEDTGFGRPLLAGNIQCFPGSDAQLNADEVGLPYTFMYQESATLLFRQEPGAAGIPAAITGTVGDKVTLPKKAPSLKGYTFLGWQKDSGYEPVYQPGATLTLTGDMTLVPLFRKNGLVQEGTCGSDTKWTLDKKGILTVSGTGRAEMITPETGNRITAKGLVIEEGVYALSSGLLRNVTVKGKVTIPASMQRIFEGVFADQPGITGVSFASDMDGLGLRISEDAFRGCTGLKGTVTLPYQLISLDATAFDGCTGITALNTATTSTYGGFSGVDGVLYCVASGWRLVRCPEGKTGAITIPTNTIYIQSEAFRNTKVTKIYYEGGEETWKYIDGREYLPVYPTFAYEIRYYSNVHSPSQAQLTMSNPNPNSILASQSVTLKNPTMQGYIFRGWYNDAEEKVTKIAKGTSAAVRLTARFDPITYTLAYNANGGKGSMAKMTATYDQDLTVAQNGFTRPGYTFAGWNTAKNGTGTRYMPGDTPSNLTTKQKGTVTLYAQWKKNK